MASEKVVRIRGPDVRHMWNPNEVREDEGIAIFFLGDVRVCRVKKGKKAWWWRQDLEDVKVPPSKWTVLRNFIHDVVAEAQRAGVDVSVFDIAVVVTETEILLCKWWEKTDDKGRVWRFFKPVARLEVDVDRVREVEMRLQWWRKFGGKLVEDIVPRRLPRDPELRKERIEEARRQLELFMCDAAEIMFFALQEDREELASEAEQYLNKVKDLMKKLEELAKEAEKETEKQEKTEEVEVQSEAENKDWREEARHALKGEKVDEVKRRKVLTTIDLISETQEYVADIEKVEDHRDYIIVHLRRDSEKVTLKCRVREQLGFSGILPAVEPSLEELEAADSEDVVDRGWIASERVIDECEVINTELPKAETVNIKVNVVERVQRVKRGRKVYEYRRMEVVIPKSEYGKLKEGKAKLVQGDVEVEVRVIKSVKRWRGKEYERWAVLIPTSEQRKLRPGKAVLVLSS
ncbi:MAG: hypothetical protein J7K15_10260 [Deltaproteobacteria bacterium]|nr:hypothetical protein [Deltaproteobacteria bacterium]